MDSTHLAVFVFSSDCKLAGAAKNSDTYKNTSLGRLSCHYRGARNEWRARILWRPQNVKWRPLLSCEQWRQGIYATWARPPRQPGRDVSHSEVPVTSQLADCRGGNNECFSTFTVSVTYTLYMLPSFVPFTFLATTHFLKIKPEDQSRVRRCV